MHYYFLIVGKTCFAARWNEFAGRIWPAGCSLALDNPDANYEEDWWKHTPLSESNINCERLWLVDSVNSNTVIWRPARGTR